MARQNYTQPENTQPVEKKEITLKSEHSASTLFYKGVELNLAEASPEVLQDLYNTEIWQYLFN